jgi:hypothetical protein
LQYVLKRTAKAGIPVYIVVQMNTYAHRFFRKRGFIEVGNGEGAVCHCMDEGEEKKAKDLETRKVGMITTYSTTHDMNSTVSEAPADLFLEPTPNELQAAAEEAADIFEESLRKRPSKTDTRASLRVTGSEGLDQKPTPNELKTAAKEAIDILKERERRSKMNTEVSVGTAGNEDLDLQSNDDSGDAEQDSSSSADSSIETPTNSPKKPLVRQLLNDIVKMSEVFREATMEAEAELFGDLGTSTNGSAGPDSHGMTPAEISLAKNLNGYVRKRKALSNRRSSSTRTVSRSFLLELMERPLDRKCKNKAGSGNKENEQENPVNEGAKKRFSTSEY